MRTSVDSSRNPLFADLLQGVHLRNSFFFRPELRAPWGFSVTDHGTTFHIVACGRCWLQITRVAKPMRLSAGDFVIVTRGDAHTLRDAQATPIVDFFDLAKRHTPDDHGVFRVGDKGPITRLVCGGMQFENVATDPLLAVLPPLLRVKRTAEGARHWLDLTVEHILAELDSGGAGAKEIVIRLADILFIQAVRAYFQENADAAEFGWLAAVRDPQIGQALAMLHSHPHQPWTVASLARRLAISRSAFAARFTELVGEPPFRYLVRLRINGAASRLRTSDDKLSVIATSAGYESMAALSKAFKRHMGMTPGEYRRASRTGGSV
jgi:AraC-like DNA-binding protein